MLRIAPLSAPHTQHKVSVVIPCYNYARYLSECLDSVLSQPDVDLDVTVFDDCSTDNSVEVAESYRRADRRVRLVRQPANLGHIATFNAALESAESEFIVKLDADDIIAPGALRRSADLLAHCPSVSFVYGQPLEFGQSVPTAPTRPIRSWTVWSSEEWLSSRMRRGHNTIMQPEVMIRRSALCEVGGHRADIAEASDFNLWLRLASAGSVAHIDGPVQGFYRVHDQSMQRTIHAGKLSDLNARWRAIELFFAERGDALPTRTTLQATARRTLARDALRLAARAYDTGDHTAEPVRDYLDFALALEPSLATSRRFRSVLLRRALSEHGHQRFVQSTPGAVTRDLEDRLRWRYWRRYGL